MPLSVDYQWEETGSKVLIRVFLKRVKKEAIDVFISDGYVKVNCAPYLWECDLKNFVDVASARYGVEEDCTVRIALQKSTPDLVWHNLKYPKDTPDRITRRNDSKQRAEALYNTSLEARENQKVKEEKRFFNEHWELEKQQRAEIETKVQAEREDILQDLDAWQGGITDREQAGEMISEVQGKERVLTPANIVSDNSIFPSDSSTNTVPVRTMETTTISIGFTPSSSIHMPQRSRSDEEVYRRSRYKPKSIEDTPCHFKEKGDKQCKAKNWKGAADSYSEALKRDTCFLSALTNRSICWLMLHNYARAIEDCTLGLNMLQSTPAANTTGDRFRHGMMKLYSRRSAALCWAGRYEEGLKDIEMAIGYSPGEQDEVRAKLMEDMETIKQKMTTLGLLTEFEISPVCVIKSEADRLVSSKDYSGAYDKYTTALEERPDYWDALANRTVVLLCQKRFKEVIRDCDVIIQHCQAVAAALADGGVGEMSAVQGDSDDEDELGEDGEPCAKKKASSLIKSSTSHVYSLLKAFVRKGAAYAGMKDYRAAYEHFELALRIMPYDNDLRDDVEAFKQKLQMNNVVAAATNKQSEIQ